MTSDDNDHSIRIPGIALEVCAYTSGDDVIIALNAPGLPCRGRIILKKVMLYRHELDRVVIGDSVLAPSLPPRK
jgi:hypothetical protein